MKKLLKISAGVIAIALASLPLSFFTTILTLPLWEWLEAERSVDAIGYHGPRAWCYKATNVALLVIGYGLYALALFRRRARHEAVSSPVQADAGP